MKRKLIIITLCLILLFNFGCGEKEEKPILEPTPISTGPPAGKLDAIVIKTLDNLDEYNEQDHFVILKINSTICPNCWLGEYEKYKVEKGDELVFYFYNTFRPLPNRDPPLPGVKTGDKIKAKFGGLKTDFKVKTPEKLFDYYWKIYDYEIIK